MFNFWEISFEQFKKNCKCLFTRTTWVMFLRKMRHFELLMMHVKKIMEECHCCPFFDLKKLVWLHTASCLMHSSQGKTREEVWEEGLVLPPTKLHWYTIHTAINLSTIFMRNWQATKSNPRCKPELSKTKSVFSQEMRNYKNEN